MVPRGRYAGWSTRSMVVETPGGRSCSNGAASATAATLDRASGQNHLHVDRLQNQTRDPARAILQR